MNRTLIDLEHGAAINAQDEDGRTALRYAVDGTAANGRNPDALRMLLKRHANPNMKDRRGNTPLGIASYMVRVFHSKDTDLYEVTRLLRAAGATE